MKAPPDASGSLRLPEWLGHEQLTGVAAKCLSPPHPRLQESFRGPPESKHGCEDGNTQLGESVGARTFLALGEGASTGPVAASHHRGL